ncbi:peptidyl-tRNA hydrolase [Aureobasidium pullulans]|uniref:peptidyl-tRNA hydrolase n=2 Tax=Aureobasidium pullulans TaxID=5580 RepID=A0A4S8YV83_AURPU|nr:peptidyl-tRNA hydrolase [Aureobasidium pullulans]THW57913.1 peptidyl-tRNA hydrolase [Aureobasidium pullulans]
MILDSKKAITKKNERLSQTTKSQPKISKVTSPKMVKARPADRSTISEEPQTADSQQQEAVANDIITSAPRPDSPISVASTSSTFSTPKKKKNRRAKGQQTPPSRVDTPLAATSTTLEDDEMTSLPLLICSLGNPGAAYANTLHSAGHNVVAALATLLQTSQFTKDRSYGNGSLTRSYSPETPWTLWQSPTYMNESGKGVSSAYRTWIRENPQGRLVVVHDELEKPLGSVTVRDKEGLSARGHNGLKSCLASLGGVKFVRVGVGIGRPVSRAPDDVARYVLKKMTPVERQKVEGSAEDVINKLLAVRG